ncbi:hypothetical protein HMPREF2534_00518 [Bacteroides thetaiotaomicron]|nr:hypothetical protein HMPREF2534_00518 [Bacteroides thetaiotaomicron]
MHNCSRLVAQVCLSDYSTVTLLFLYDWIGGMKKSAVFSYEKVKSI